MFAAPTSIVAAPPIVPPAFERLKETLSGVVRSPEMLKLIPALPPIMPALLLSITANKSPALEKLLALTSTTGLEPIVPPSFRRLKFAPELPTWVTSPAT